MFHGMYEHEDRFGKKHYLSARIGGFRTTDQARKAVVKRGGEGYISDEHNVVLHVVRKGHIVNFTKE